METRSQLLTSRQDRSKGKGISVRNVEAGTARLKKNDNGRVIHMAIDNSFMARKIQTRKQMYVPFCAVTGMPFIVCDPETFNDQVRIFETEELLRGYIKEQAEQKNILRAVEVKNKDFLSFFSSLFMTGINELVFIDKENVVNMGLEAIVKKPDYSKLKPEQRPVTNPNLVLTGMYFMQEAGRQVPQEEKNLADLEEELSANMIKSRYIMAIELPEGPGTLAEKLQSKNYKLPILKDKQGNAFQPLFTDPIELAKFTKGKKMSAIAVPFGELTKLLTSEAKGYMLNPNGFHIMMPKQLLEALPKRFQ